MRHFIHSREWRTENFSNFVGSKVEKREVSADVYVMIYPQGPRTRCICGSSSWSCWVITPVRTSLLGLGMTWSSKFWTLGSWPGGGGNGKINREWTLINYQEPCGITTRKTLSSTSPDRDLYIDFVEIRMISCSHSSWKQQWELFHPRLD